MTWVPPEEYFFKLPRKAVSAGALFFNDSGKLLIVKPNYKDHWEIVGGSVDENESPLQAVIRETVEEIGILDRKFIFLGVDYVSGKSDHREWMSFIFDGGILSDEKIKGIKLQTEELDDFRFIDPGGAGKFLSQGTTRRVATCLKVIREHRSVYLEDGEINKNH